MSKIKLALLYGGKSGEHEISLQSAAAVLSQLDPAKYDVLPIGMAKDGTLYLNQAEALRAANYTALPIQGQNATCLPSLIHQGKFIVDVDVVFPMAHGPLYEDGALQGKLELANVAYVGCDVLSSAIGMDKDVARRLAMVEGLSPIAYHRLPYTESVAQDKARCEAAAEALGFPLFVKPTSLGSSVGVSKVFNMSELLLAVAKARRYDTSVLIEQAITGREIELAVLEHEGGDGLPDVSVPGETKTAHADGFYSYAAKYTECDTLELCVPAVLDESLVRRLQVASAEIFMRLHCVGFARIDFFVQDDTKKIYFNEINTLPGFTNMSLFPKLWQASGLSYPDLLDRIITLAITRHTCKSKLITDYMSDT